MSYSTLQLLIGLKHMRCLDLSFQQALLNKVSHCFVGIVRVSLCTVAESHGVAL